MVKNVVKSVSEKMICGHHFEVCKCSENSSAGREELHRKQLRNTPNTTCGLSTESNENYVVRRRLNHMVKLCGQSREAHIIFSPGRCCIVTLVTDFVKAP